MTDTRKPCASCGESLERNTGDPVDNITITDATGQHHLRCWQRLGNTLSSDGEKVIERVTECLFQRRNVIA